jgi:hypothetical protein
MPSVRRAWSSGRYRIAAAQSETRARDRYAFWRARPSARRRPPGGCRADAAAGQAKEQGAEEEEEDEADDAEDDDPGPLPCSLLSQSRCDGPPAPVPVVAGGGGGAAAAGWAGARAEEARDADVELGGAATRATRPSARPFLHSGSACNLVHQMTLSSSEALACLLTHANAASVASEEKDATIAIAEGGSRSSWGAAADARKDAASAAARAAAASAAAAAAAAADAEEEAEAESGPEEEAADAAAAASAAAPVHSSLSFA